MKRRFIAIVAGVLLLCIGVSLASYAIKENRKITALEYFNGLDEYMSQLSDFTDELDTIVTLYISGSIDADFVYNIEYLKSQLMVIKNYYMQNKEANPIKTGSQNYTTKAGIEALESCYDTLDELLDVMLDNYGDIDAVTYNYLLYKQELITHVANYNASCYVISEYYSD